MDIFTLRQYITSMNSGPTYVIAVRNGFLALGVSNHAGRGSAFRIPKMPTEVYNMMLGSTTHLDSPFSLPTWSNISAAWES